MNKFYKRFIFLILLLVVISGGVIYFTVDINTLQNLTEFKPWAVMLAIFFVGIGLLLDGSRLMHLVRISNEHITLSQAVQVVFGNYFLALLTPGATGGAVAQLIFLRHAGVPAGKATVLVIVRTLVSILFLVLCMPFIFLHDTEILPWVSDDTLMVISFFVFVGILAIIWAFKTNFLDYFVIKLAKRFARNRRKKVVAFYRDIKSAALLLSAAPRCMLRVFIESGLSLIAIYSVVPFLLLGLGVEFDWYGVMGRMIFLNMLLYFSPTPGGSGIAEGGFVLLFNEIVPAGTVGIVAVFWRIIAEYIPFLIGFYYTIKVFGRDFLNKQLTK
jgi:glycosyltransferase 2 family protein